IGPDRFLYDDAFNRLELERDAGGRIRAMRFFANGDGQGEVGLRTDEPLPAAPVALQLPRAVVGPWAGTYAEARLTLKVYLEAAALKAQRAGQPPVGLRPTSPTMCDVEETGATVEFSVGDGPSAAVTMRQNGRELVLDRVP